MKLVPSVVLLSLVSLNADAQWSQIGANPKHTGSVPVAAQPLLHLLSDITYDPFVAKEQAEANGDLFVHYQVPLVDGDDVYMEFKSGQFVSPEQWETQTWSIHGLRWQNGALVDRWSAVTDWKPVPGSSIVEFEPVFHAVLANGSVYMPASGGTLLQLDRNDGHVIRRVNPFATVDPNTYVSGVPAADTAGNIYYGAFRFDAAGPLEKDITGAWLVRVKPDGSATSVPFATLVPNAPNATDQCTTSFSTRTQPRPWPPTPTSVAPTAPCGSVRPGINAAPAIAADGTIYVVGHSHFNPSYGFLIAVNPDLTPKWSTSMRNIFNDGCGVLVPYGTANNACRAGATLGVDPNTNQPGSGIVIDDSTSSPVVAPDGSVLYGAYTVYNGARGHLIRFSSTGAIMANYDFGWDTTPAVWEHGGTYSIVMKENFYAQQAYYITQLDPNLKKEWQFKSTETHACGRGPDGVVTCVDEQPNGFEWCVNAPAIDIRGTVYANSEDGNLYAIAQGGTVEDKIFLQLALGAGYTPVSIGPDGRLYAQNAGHLFAVGGSRPRHRAVGR
jgi:outer membrane protein assembly factor BamB